MKRLLAMSFYAVLLAAFAAASIQSTLQEHQSLGELQLRGDSLLTGIEDSLQSALGTHHMQPLARTAARLRRHPGVIGIALCPTGGRALGFPSGVLPWRMACASASASRGDSQAKWTWSAGGHHYLVSSRLYPGTSSMAPSRVLLVQDLSGLKAEWVRTFVRVLALSWVAGALITLMLISLLKRWIQGFSKIQSSTAKILTLPVRLRAEYPSEPSWLSSLRRILGGRTPVVIANREPYIHQKQGGRIEVIRPASGLVTALEPILRQAGGLWIGHGSGTADREVADPQGEVPVPPEHPSYTLKRVWLSDEEEQGYYYGFSNEGLWPLCHLAHTRPVFRLGDWQQYCRVNRRFADATPASVLDERSLVLVQDYHYALLPRMLRERAADLGASCPRTSLFWHIPWPNAEAFGICPWNKEVLLGMLGGDMVGFHTQDHCNNFLETCDRYLEARVDWARFSVTVNGRETLVRAFPIGIDTSPVRTISESERRELKNRYGIAADLVAVGVDRLDYTKGLVERVEAVERFLEKYPSYIGRFSFVQMGSPSRTHIPAYQALTRDLDAAVARVNHRFGSPEATLDGIPRYQPVILLDTHHEWEEIQYFYQIGDVCLVTSLHDGMNLVAKEYVWCQQPDRGGLILSRFTGAARELSDALIVNPYSIEEMADAIAQSLMMPEAERARRMRAMRGKVEAHNAFHWATDIIRVLINEVKPPRGEGTRGMRPLSQINEARGETRATSPLAPRGPAGRWM